MGRRAEMMRAVSSSSGTTTGAAGGTSQPGARRGAREPVLNGGGEARRLSRLGHHAAHRRFGSVALGNAALSEDGRHVRLPPVRSTTIRPTGSRSDCSPLQGHRGAGHRAHGAARRGIRLRPAGCAPGRGRWTERQPLGSVPASMCSSAAANGRRVRSDTPLRTRPSRSPSQ